ncbi:MFS transporter [Acinetobacter sichuanensis]|uniref:MFS transporter n=1 Tax=Acinetobacter sichuanensis TaxID=2136183 RepID=A0A371YNH0_9GAMM|nr:MFS transporter [Acinetobacter sichuanensis]RFC83021.1 MFS transporter [Acinetobacter sichuanensis]
MRNKIPLEEVPLNKFHKKLTIYSAGGPFLDGYVLSIIGVVMLQISSALHLTLFWEGLVAASALVGIFFGGFLGGWLTDKIGRKLLYILNLVIIVGLSVAQFWVETALMLVVLRFLIGAAVGADCPIATSLLAEFLPRKNRGPRLSALVTAWFLGTAAAYIIGELILSVIGPDAWRWVLVSALIPGILFLVGRLGTPESARWLISQGRTEEADKIIKKIYGNEYSVNDLPEQQVDEKNKVSITSLFHSGYGKRTLFVGLFWTCSIIPLFAIYAFAPKVMLALNLTGEMAKWGAVAITILFCVGCAVATLTINTVGRKRMLSHSFFWSGLMLLLLGLFPSASSVVILILFGGYALFIGGAQVMQYVYPNELFPTEVRATAVGLGTSLSRIGAAAGTYFVPLALAHWGIGTTMLIAAAISLVGLWVTQAWAPDIDGVDLHQAASLSKN